MDYQAQAEPPVIPFLQKPNDVADRMWEQFLRQRGGGGYPMPPASPPTRGPAIPQMPPQQMPPPGAAPPGRMPVNPQQQKLIQALLMQMMQGAGGA